jgi:signal transduction histidine kinase
MGFQAIPDTEAVLLVRALGLLFHQAGIYGPSHNVAQTAARCVFAELEQMLNTFGPIEIATGENLMLVNGASEGLGAAAGKNLLDRMTLYKLGGLLFMPPLDQREFLYLVQLFGTPPAKLAQDGGFEAVLKKADLRSVRVVSVAYQRLTGDEPAAETDKTKSLYFSSDPVTSRMDEAPKAAIAKPGILDLSFALAGGQSLRHGETRAAPITATESPSQTTRRERAQALAAMLRDAAAVLERGMDAPDSADEIGLAIQRIRGALTDLTAGSRREIATLASEVDEDSKTIASIESAARRRGIELKLTRDELMRRYAELNQEIAQPLTVSSGVIALLQSGKSGALNDSQRELLKMANEGVERVNQLVSYLTRIAGLPDSLSPDEGLLRDTYR